MQQQNVVFIDGTRTPFLKSGTGYAEAMSYQLGQAAISGLLRKTNIDLTQIDAVIMGNVIANIQTTNVARESALTAGIPATVPCSTVSMMCISANKAIANGIEQLKTGQAEVVIAGGVDNVSDIPITFKKKMRQKLFNARKLKTTTDYLKFGTTLRPGDFAPEVPAIAEFSTNRTMGQDCDRLADRIGISRQAQDQFAARSHQNTHQAYQNGIIQQEVSPVELAPAFERIDKDNGFREDSTKANLAKLKPAFAKPYGTLTAANSSFLTDGAAVVLLCTESKAKELGLQPKAIIKEYCFTAQDLDTALLLGPANSIAHLFKNKKYSLSDFEVFEIHEAFAGQVLANLKCLSDEHLCKSELNLDESIGTIPMDKLNVHGGSLSIGHPFGATGARLLTTTVNRLHRENGRLGLLASCAAGAHGHAMVVEVT